MKVNVLFFGATADLVGSRAFETSLPETSVAADVISLLRAKYPNLRDRKLLVAVNEQYVGENTRLSNGDQLAVFTPVSGG
ncbi:MAG: molybdopterin converting factor subunit 1 [Acidobacteria bacterium]|nr:MAG: molybdopterin converting factor subunit 1 [Acidobacteriota bacterium]